MDGMGWDGISPDRSISRSPSGDKKHVLEKDVLEKSYSREDILEKYIVNSLWCGVEGAVKNWRACVRMMRGESIF